MTGTNERLVLTIDIDGAKFALMLPLMSAMPVTDLKSAIANLGSERTRIVDALDYLFLGI